MNKKNLIARSLLTGSLFLLVGIGVFRSCQGGAPTNGPPQDLRINVAMPSLLEGATASDAEEESGINAGGTAEGEDAEADPLEVVLTRLEIGRNAQVAALLEQLDRDRRVALCSRARQYLASANEASRDSGIAVEVWLSQRADELAAMANSKTGDVTSFSGTAEHQEDYRALYWEATAIAMVFDHLWRGAPLDCPVLSPFSTWAALEETINAGRAVRSARSR